ncbi:hypothetical protein VKT23_005685 [Stygiomarasmius scandens]|uniref:Uncharacterized protein n=1 Tax=Marasmiellus scandens TaxID=2682957 RepID=A0ABR1JT18_9AGAR
MIGQGSKQHGKHLFSRTPNSDTPPPSYNDLENDPSPVLFSETTTVTRTVTETTTTHFFSLPLWKRRPATAASEPPSTPPKNSMVADHSTPPRFSKFKLEKDLPPTPPHESGPSSPFPSRTTSQRTSLDEIFKETVLPSLFPPDHLQSPKGGAYSASSSTAALAHAALGLGLPHVLSHAASASHPELNTIAFNDSPSTSFDSPPSRRPSARALSSAGRPGDSSKSTNRRRTRGLSLGPASFLNFGSSESKGKGKEKELPPGQTAEPPSRLLRRKSSFWSRRKSTVDGVESLPPKTELIPPLPTVPPISPFALDNTINPSPANQHKPQHSRGLSRSHSERISPQPLSLDISVLSDSASYPKPQRQHRRPVTADSTTRAEKSPRLLLSDDQRLTSSPTAEQPLSSSQQPRARALTNPPFLHRLSMNLFMSSSVSTPSSPVVSGPPSRVSSSKNTSSIPKALVDEESPEGYLSRLMDSVSKAEIAAVLASSNDPFHVQALRSYIGRFDFADDPLDVALRRLLMDVGLPRETQQIDRVMEAFASRYYQSHPKLFISEDHPYILAFSLIMLHTDAFNKSNKRKMTKQDYIKNTRLPGVAPEILDCFYDNIVFAPFIFIEDPFDVNGQRGFIDGSPRKSSTSMGNSISPSTSLILGKGNKVDPYYLISHNLLDHLRVDVEAYVPLTNPYSYEGTAGPWDEEELQASFAQANVISVEGADSSKPPSSFFGLGPGIGPASPLVASAPGPPLADSETWNLKVTKVGLLNRKDEALEGGKKANNRKWKIWNVILTGSQLLFFRDTSSSWTNIPSAPSDGQTVLPRTFAFKPDEIFSVKDAIAVYDRSYTKHEYTFRFFMRDGRQFLLSSSDEQQMNQWISRINYASAFKSTGVRMRPVGMSGRDLQLTGVAAATSHLHDLQHMSSPRVKQRDGDSLQDMDGSSNHARRSATLVSNPDEVDPDTLVSPEVEGADQFKATFDQVKADLAAGRCASPDSNGRSGSIPAENERLPSRARVVLSKVREMDSKISAAQTQLETDIRLVRNIATLTPFQRTTRERLLTAVQGVSKRVMSGRLEVLRLTCHRDVLLNDLAAEGRVWNRAKKMALKAATETLQSQQVPRMTLSFHESQSVASPPIPIPQKSPTSSLPRPESTAGSVQSFHSALDWPIDDVSTSNFLEASQTIESPRNSSAGSLHAPGNDRVPLDGLSPRTSEEQPSHQKFYTAQESPEEQAEEWDKTRCVSGRPRARVSLVRVPSTIGLSARFEKGRADEGRGTS